MESNDSNAIIMPAKRRKAKDDKNLARGVVEIRMSKSQKRKLNKLEEEKQKSSLLAKTMEMLEGSNKVLDTVKLSLPRYSYESQAVWIQVPQAVSKAVESRNFSFRAGMHATSHAVLNVVPLCIICNFF